MSSWAESFLKSRAALSLKKINPESISSASLSQRVVDEEFDAIASRIDVATCADKNAASGAIDLTISRKFRQSFIQQRGQP